MAELSERQIEQAAKAMHGSDWERLKPDDKERYRTAARAAAPYLQLPWDEPTYEELDIAVSDARIGDLASSKDILHEFVRRRNAALQPKPVDPAVEVVSRMLRDRSLDTSYDDYAALLVKAVRSIPPAVPEATNGK